MPLARRPATRATTAAAPQETVPMNLKPGQLYLGHPVDPAGGKPGT